MAVDLIAGEPAGLGAGVERGRDYCRAGPAPSQKHGVGRRAPRTPVKWGTSGKGRYLHRGRAPTQRRTRPTYSPSLVDQAAAARVTSRKINGTSSHGRVDGW
jgi:hypothetical protein